MAEETKDTKKNAKEDETFFRKFAEAFSSVKNEETKPVETKPAETVEKKEDRSWLWDLGIGALCVVAGAVGGVVVTKMISNGNQTAPIMGSQPPL